jgi:hypothetical protein
MTQDVERGPDGKIVVPDHVAQAVRTLIEWAGDDPGREGLIDTPKRVARAWLEYCQGYEDDPAVHLSRTFEEVGGYDEIVLLRDIPFQSHCEHHMAPITGKASIAYLPRDRVVGISKLARVLQFQFYQAACKQAGWKGPLHRCSFYGNKAVGAKLNAMLEMGASKPWPDALEAFTGTREMSGKAMAEYFAPLKTWLDEQNKGKPTGW